MPSLPGSQLRALRQEAGLTQLDLARRSGISRAYLAALERGLSSATKAPPNPSKQVLAAIAQALGLSLEALRHPETSRPELEEAAEGLKVLGVSPGPGASQPQPWSLPEADGIVMVGDTVNEALGLMADDAVLIRHLGTDEPPPEGLCLLETKGAWSWGQIAFISNQPYLGAADGSYRPMPKGTRLKAKALAIVRLT